LVRGACFDRLEEEEERDEEEEDGSVMIGGVREQFDGEGDEAGTVRYRLALKPGVLEQQQIPAG